MAAVAPLAPFLWGDDGTVQTPEEAARLRAVAAALAQSNRAPKDVGEGLSRVGDALLYRANMGRAADAEKTGMAQAASEIAGLGDNPDRAALTAALSDPWVTSNPGQAAVVQALLGRNLAANDPGAALDREYKQAQIDALKAKPAQSLVNTADGIYDPNSQSWIAPPAAAPSNAPVVGFGDDGNPDPKAQDAYLATLDPKYAAIVKGVANYELDPAKITSLRGDQRQKLVEDAKAYDPTYDGTQFGAKAATRKDFMAGQSALNLKSANTLIGHLNDLAKASDALGNQGFTPLNAVVNTGKALTGNPDITTYKVTAQAAADELAKVFKGSGASDVASIAGWQGSLDPNNSPAQQKAAIKQAVTLLESRVAALRDQYQNAMQKPADFTFLNTESAKALKDMGIDPTEVDPNYKDGAPATGAPATATAYATNPQTNQRIMLVDGQWVPAQ